MINHPNRSKKAKQSKINVTLTLGAIRAQRPCSEGWTKLLVSLGYTNGNFDPEKIVSLGDVAKSNNASDALWCVRALDWNDIAVRRAIIAGTVLLAVIRVVKFAKNPRVAECVDALKRWCKGEDVDLKEVRKKARTSADAYAADAATAAAYAAATAAAYAADAAADAAATAATYAADAAAAADATYAERKQQQADIIAAFQPIALKGKKQ